MKRALAILLVIATATALFYVSWFWPFELWSRDSWLSQLGLRPQGGLLQVWLRGTSLAQFELMIWAVASFVILSVTEFLVQRLRKHT